MYAWYACSFNFFRCYFFLIIKKKLHRKKLKLHAYQAYISLLNFSKSDKIKRTKFCNNNNKLIIN